MLEFLHTEEIVDSLIKLRNNKNWTNYKIAIESDLPASTISNIFNKRSMPQLDTLLAICKGFDITPAYLFNEKTKNESLTDDENEIINLWEKLDAKSKEMIKNIINILYQQNNR